MDVARVLALQQTAGNAAVARALARRSAIGSPAPLPSGLRRGVASLSGHDLGDVGVHYDSPAPAALSALAYAGEDEVHLGPGREDLLPHEAWHVVQQRDGRVHGTRHGDINDDPRLEREAHEQGERAAAQPASATPTQARRAERAGAVKQLVGLTIAVLQSLLGTGNPTAGGTQISFTHQNAGGDLSALAFHVSASLAASGIGAVDRVHLSYYPANDLEMKRKVIHYEYAWRAADETFGPPSQRLETWQPFKTKIGAIQQHASARMAELRAGIVAALHQPAPMPTASAPIAIPVGTGAGAMDITPENTPPGGWGDTPPGTWG